MKGLHDIALNSLCNGPAQRLTQKREAAPQDNRLRMDEVDSMGEAKSEVIGCFVEDSQSLLIAFFQGRQERCRLFGVESWQSCARRLSGFS